MIGPTRMSQERRLQKEIQSIQEEINAPNADPDVTAELVDDDIRHWLGRIKGPVGTPYENGIFYLDIRIPDEYPYAAPKIRFETPVWHPNVSSRTGAICLDILKNEWSPALTVRTALLSIEALLSDPYPDDPQDAEVATMYNRNRQEFNDHAKSWVQKYASAIVWPRESKIRILEDMGIDREIAKVTLVRLGDRVSRQCFGSTFGTLIWPRMNASVALADLYGVFSVVAFASEQG